METKQFLLKTARIIAWVVTLVALIHVFTETDQDMRRVRARSRARTSASRALRSGGRGRRKKD